MFESFGCSCNEASVDRVYLDGTVTGGKTKKLNRGSVSRSNPKN